MWCTIPGTGGSGAHAWSHTNTVSTVTATFRVALPQFFFFLIKTTIDWRAWGAAGYILCSPLRLPGDSVAARMLVGAQAGGDKWACCTSGRHCESLTILADTWEKHIVDRHITTLWRQNAMQRYFVYISIYKLQGSKKRNSSLINTCKTGMNWYLHSSQLLAIQVGKSQSGRQASRSIVTPVLQGNNRSQMHKEYSCLDLQEYMLSVIRSSFSAYLKLLLILLWKSLLSWIKQSKRQTIWLYVWLAGTPMKSNVCV